MKSVCIVGAGPAGLVAAKTFLETKQFDVKVYEKQDRIGGIWALDRSSTNGFLSPDTPTNLSRFTVGFSDLDWNSVKHHKNAMNRLENGSTNGSKPPMFPKAWMANMYLEEYRDRYIPKEKIFCGREITEAKRFGDQWRVTSKDLAGQAETLYFDYLVMASGFFAQPRLLEQDVMKSGNVITTGVKKIHSSAFRNLSDLFPEGRDVSGKNILMIGGGNSSGETAAAVALQISNAQWSPDTSHAERYKDCKIIHVTPRPLYPLPPFVEYEESSRSYVPLDFKLYDFAKRPIDLPSYGGRQTMQVRDMVHGALQTMAGGDLSDISEALVSKKGEGRGSVYVALSESYSEYVRSDMIDVISGRVTRVEDGEAGSATAIITKDGKESRIDDIGAVIYASGYTPCPALDMLDDNTKAALHYDSTSMRLPMILEQWQTMSSRAPAISFLGFYEGPYWPVIEMQARLTAERWLSSKVTSQRPYEKPDELLQLRETMRQKGLDVPQYWLGDHLGYMEDIANELKLERNYGNFASREGMPSPARYISSTTTESEANSIMDELHDIWHDCIQNGRYVSRAAFRALQGKWTINRKIESRLSSFPSGTLTGEATFHPRIPTSDQNVRIFDLEYLYVESGTFTASTGLVMTTRRRYVYRYSEPEDTLSIWFVKPDNDLEVDYLFHDLEFVKPQQAREADTLVAKADHLCVKDMYWTEYRLPVKGVALRNFRIKHTVKGPDKDYVMSTTYERPPK